MSYQMSPVHVSVLLKKYFISQKGRARLLLPTPAASKGAVGVGRSSRSSSDPSPSRSTAATRCTARSPLGAPTETLCPFEHHQHMTALKSRGGTWVISAHLTSGSKAEGNGASLPAFRAPRGTCLQPAQASAFQARGGTCRAARRGIEGLSKTRPMPAVGNWPSAFRARRGTCHAARQWAQELSANVPALSV